MRMTSFQALLGRSLCEGAYMGAVLVAMTACIL